MAIWKPNIYKTRNIYKREIIYRYIVGMKMIIFLSTHHIYISTRTTACWWRGWSGCRSPPPRCPRCSRSRWRPSGSRTCSRSHTAGNIIQVSMKCCDSVHNILCNNWPTLSPWQSCSAASLLVVTSLTWESAGLGADVPSWKVRDPDEKLRGGVKNLYQDWSS